MSRAFPAVRPRFTADRARRIKIAVLAPLLFLPLLSLAEMAILAATSSRLDAALAEVARGTSAASRPSEVAQRVCARLGGSRRSCLRRLTIELGAAADRGPPMQVRASYRWPLVTPLIVTRFERVGPMAVRIVSAARAG